MFSMVPYPLFETTRKNPQRIKKSDREVLLELNYGVLSSLLVPNIMVKLGERKLLISTFSAIRTNNFTLCMSRNSIMRMY